MARGQPGTVALGSAARWHFGLEPRSPSVCDHSNSRLGDVAPAQNTAAHLDLPAGTPVGKHCLKVTNTPVASSARVGAAKEAMGVTRAAFAASRVKV